MPCGCAPVLFVAGEWGGFDLHKRIRLATSRLLPVYLGRYAVLKLFLSSTTCLQIWLMCKAFQSLVWREMRSIKCTTCFSLAELNNYASPITIEKRGP